MSTFAPLGSATSKVGGKEVPRTNSFPTSVAPENANGAPLEKGKAVVVVASDAVKVKQFTDYTEVKDSAGEHYEATVLDWANGAARSWQLGQIRARSKKLSVMPASVTAFVQSVCDAFDLASMFAVCTGAKKERTTIKKSALADLEANAASMSKEDILAALAALTR